MIAGITHHQQHCINLLNLNHPIELIASACNRTNFSRFFAWVNRDRHDHLVLVSGSRVACSHDAALLDVVVQGVVVAHVAIPYAPDAHVVPPARAAFAKVGLVVVQAVARIAGGIVVWTADCVVMCLAGTDVEQAFAYVTIPSGSLDGFANRVVPPQYAACSDNSDFVSRVVHHHADNDRRNIVVDRSATALDEEQPDDSSDSSCDDALPNWRPSVAPNAAAHRYASH